MTALLAAPRSLCRGVGLAIGLASSTVHCSALTVLPPSCADQGADHVWSTVEIRFRDPSQVTLETTDGRVLVPAGTGPMEAELQANAPPNGMTGTYVTHVAREEGGALVVRWVTNLPMSSGHREILVLPDGTFRGFPVSAGAGASALGLPAALRQPDLHVDLFVWLHGGRLGYVPNLAARGVGAAGWPQLRVSTPWSNVLTVREESRDNLIEAAGCPTHVTGVALYPLSDRQ
jgi:hypothetical protein